MGAVSAPSGAAGVPVPAILSSAMPNIPLAEPASAASEKSLYAAPGSLSTIETACSHSSAGSVI